MAYMGEVGNKVVYLPLRARTCWFRNEESLVYWVKQADGSFTYDYRIFDRYMDLVQKYLKPDVYCLYALDFSRRGTGAMYSVLDPATGKVTFTKGAAYEPTPEQIAFWKSVVDDVMGRLKKRGVKKDEMMIGMAWEGGGTIGKTLNKKVALFEKVIPPGMKQVQLAHFGGVLNQKGAGDKISIPFGYVMSVFGNRGKVRSNAFGSKNIEMNIVQHYRAGGSDDVRPTAPRGFMRLCAENALKTTRGIGPLGMDFWCVPSDESKGRKWHGGIPQPMEGQGASNLSMSMQSSGIFLAPGPDGPVSTARFEMFREGLQECEARLLIEAILNDAGKRAILDAALVKECEELLAERDQFMSLSVFYSRGYGYGEGWKWYESSGWEDRAYDLFVCAGKVAKSLKK